MKKLTKKLFIIGSFMILTISNSYAEECCIWQGVAKSAAKVKGSDGNWRWLVDCQGTEGCCVSVGPNGGTIHTETPIHILNVNSGDIQPIDINTQYTILSIKAD